MKTFGLLTTSILLTISLAMYSRYFSESATNYQQSRVIRAAQQIASRRRAKRLSPLFRSQVISKLPLKE